MADSAHDFNHSAIVGNFHFNLLGMYFGLGGEAVTYWTVNIKTDLARNNHWANNCKPMVMRKVIISFICGRFRQSKLKSRLKNPCHDLQKSVSASVSIKSAEL